MNGGNHHHRGDKKGKAKERPKDEEPEFVIFIK
jgi:hypothetical protein